MSLWQGRKISPRRSPDLPGHEKKAAMSAKKIVLIVVAVVVLAGIVVGSILHSQASVTKVATGKVVRQDIVSIVNGTGQIKPKTYVNIGATAFGRITHLYVKEGDHVKAGQLVATVESEQPASAVEAQHAPSPHRRPMSTPTLRPSAQPRRMSNRPKPISNRRNSITSALRASTTRS